MFEIQIRNCLLNFCTIIYSNLMKSPRDGKAFLFRGVITEVLLILVERTNCFRDNANEFVGLQKRDQVNGRENE